MTKALPSFAFICFFSTVGIQPATAHPGAAIAVDAKGRVYFVDTGHGVWMVDAAGKLVDLVVVRIDRRGTVTTVLRAESPWAPTAVALHGNDVYVLEYLHTPGDDRRQWLPRVRKVDSGQRVSTVATVNRPTR